MQRPFFHRLSAFVALTLACSLPALAQSTAEALLGCWQGTETRVLWADGRWKNSRHDCTIWFDGQLRHHKCQNVWGAYVVPISTAYRVTEPGVMKLERSFNAQDLFTVQGNELVETALNTEDQVRSRGTREVHRHSRRLAATSLETCLPKTPVVTLDDYVRHHDLPSWIEQSVYSFIFEEMVRTIRTNWPEGIRDGASRADVKRALQEIEREALRIGQPILAPLRQDPSGFIQKHIRDEFYCKLPDSLDPSLASPSRQAWARRMGQEVTFSQRIARHLYALNLIFDQQTSLKELRAPEEVLQVHRPDSGIGIKRVHYHDREALHAFSAKPRLAELIPHHDQLPQMVALSLENEREAKSKLLWEPLAACLETGLPKVVNALLRGSNFGEQARQAGALMKTRILMTLDPRVTGACASFEGVFDTRSVREAQGDWRRVKDARGQAIEPTFQNMRSLEGFYRSTCLGKRDIASARRLKENNPTLTPADSKFGEYAYCGLAVWVRHGFGGPKDPARAAAIEAEFKAKAPPHSCDGWSDNGVLDPSDPWRVIPQ